MGLIARFGKWLDNQTAPKMTAAEVLDLFGSLESRLNPISERLTELEARLSKINANQDVFYDQLTAMKDDLTTIKAFMKFRGTKQVDDRLGNVQKLGNIQKFDGSQPWKR